MELPWGQVKVMGDANAISPPPHCSHQGPFQGISCRDLPGGLQALLL